MKTYRVERSITQVALTLCALLWGAPHSLEAQDKPQGYWTTAKQVNVHCSNGEVAGVIGAGSMVRVIGMGSEGWLRVPDLWGDDSCEGYYIAAHYLRPVEFVFWKLDEGWSDGLDVDGVHYRAGASFQVLTTNIRERTLTIVGPQGTPVTVPIDVDLRNEFFTKLRWSKVGNTLYCATTESSRDSTNLERLMRFLGKQPIALVAAAILLLLIHILSAFDYGGFKPAWLLGIGLSFFLFEISMFTLQEYDFGRSQCQAAQIFLSSRVVPEGFILPIEDGRRTPSALRGFASLDQGEYLRNFSSVSSLFLGAIPPYLFLLVKASMGLGCLLASRSKEEPAQDQEPIDVTPRTVSESSTQEGEHMAAHDEVIPEPMSIERREAKSPLRAEPLPSPSVPDVQVPNYRTEWGRSRATETARGQTALMTAMQEALETKIALTRTRAKEEDLPRILATDQCKREGELVGGLHKLVAVRSLLDLEKARAETALLEEKGKQVKIEIQIAQDKKTLERLRNSPPPLSEEEERREAVRRKIRERLSDRHTEAEIRGEERILREKILSCTNGVVTPEVQRGLDNLRDAVQGLIDEL